MAPTKLRQSRMEVERRFCLPTRTDPGITWPVKARKWFWNIAIKTEVLFIAFFSICGQSTLRGMEPTQSGPATGGITKEEFLHRRHARHALYMISATCCILPAAHLTTTLLNLLQRGDKTCGNPCPICRDRNIIIHYQVTCVFHLYTHCFIPRVLFKPFICGIYIKRNISNWGHEPVILGKK